MLSLSNLQIQQTLKTTNFEMKKINYWTDTLIKLYVFCKFRNKKSREEKNMLSGFFAKRIGFLMKFNDLYWQFQKHSGEP